MGVLKCLLVPHKTFIQGALGLDSATLERSVLVRWHGSH